MRFKPGWFPTAFMIFGVALTWSLGFWQLGRHEEKTRDREEIQRGLDGAVLTADDLATDVDSLMYRKIEVEGRWAEPVALTGGRKEFKNQVGYGVVQPLALPDGTLLLVDRGWVPRDGLAQAMTQIDGVGAQVRLRGQLRPLEGSADLGPIPSTDDFERWPPNAWPSLHGRLPDPKVDAIVLAGEPLLSGEGKDPTELPVDGYNPYPRTTDSLSYAFQWWIFGVMLIIVWGALGRHRAVMAEAGPPEEARPTTRAENG